MLNKELLLLASTENDSNTLVLYEGDKFSLMYKVTFNGKTQHGEVGHTSIRDLIEDTTEDYYYLTGLSIIKVDYNLRLELNDVQMGELITYYLPKFGFWPRYSMVGYRFKDILGTKFKIVPAE